MKFELIPHYEKLKDELSYFEFKLKEFHILTKKLKAKNLDIPLWLINQGLYYSRNKRRIITEMTNSPYTIRCD